MLRAEVHMGGPEGRRLSKQEQEREKRVREGGRLAASFVRKVELGKKVNGKRYGYDTEFILGIHARVEKGSHEAGKLRTNGVEVDTDEAVEYIKLPTRFHVFGRWLEIQMKEVNSQPDNIILALETAAAAHWGLTSPEMHPFANGNGRTARALVNAILMHSTDELRLHKIAILPVPILRDDPRDRDNRYVRSLRSVKDTRSLNPLMSYIANRWAENVSVILNNIEKVSVALNLTDKNLISTMKSRRDRLLEFISGTEPSANLQNYGYRLYPIPNYFDPVWLREGKVAETL